MKKIGHLFFLMFATLLIFSSVQLQAQESEDVLIVENTTSAPAVSNQQDTSIAAGTDEDVAVVYDPNTIDVKVENLSRSTLLAEIPPEFHIYMESLDDKDIEVFIAKKKVFLDGVSSGLKKLHFSQKRIDSWVGKLDRQFYQSAKVITQSNAYGLTYTAYVQGGLGFGDAMVDGVRKRNGWTKKIPAGATDFLAKEFENTHKFFYLMGLSLSLQRVQDAKTGKHFFILDVFAHAHFLKSITTFINYIAYEILIVGVIAETRRGNFDKIIPDQEKTVKYETDHLGGAGQVRRGEDLASVQFPVHIPVLTSFSLPPLVPAVAVFKDQGSGYRLFSINLTKLSPARFIDFFKSFVQPKASVISCRALFAR